MRARWRGFELPTRVHPEKTTMSATYGKFIAEPFERGFGHTLGNSLRRILLSHLEGAAVSAVRIDGIPHEFTAIEGIYEDIPEILLNIKKIRLKLHSDKPKWLTLKASKKGEIKAGDIEPDPDIEIINKNLHIATITNNKGKLNMQLEVRRGRGYLTAEEHKSHDQEIGVIPLDCIFSPVRRVRYRVEETRVGRRTNYDRLVIEIWTDGSTTPELALVEASKILRRHLDPFVYYFELGEEPIEAKLSATQRRMEWVKAKASEELKKTLDMPIQELELSARALSCLQGENIKDVRDLIQKSEEELLQLKNLGKSSVEDIKGKLAALGLRLGMDISQLETGE